MVAVVFSSFAADVVQATIAVVAVTAIIVIANKLLRIMVFFMHRNYNGNKTESIPICID